VEPDRSRAQPRQRATLVNTRSRETRLALIGAALRLWSDGDGDFDAAFEASTAADIAKAAGVSRGSFYFHFANKEAILLEMSSATIEEMVDQVEVGTGQGVSLRALSDEMMSLLARRVARTPKAAALRAGALGLAARSDGTMASPRLNGAFESLLRYGKERGELDADVDVDDAAAMLTAVTMEAIIRWGREDRSASWLGETLRNRVAVILRGVGR
jgi:AcrR family transcriptional regulator